jgi:hypothetical protein
MPLWNGPAKVLLRAGGFELAEVVPTRSPMSIIIGKPMSTE